MTPQTEFTVQYAEPLVRKAVNRFWLRSLGWRFTLALLGLGAIEVLALAQGDRSWRVGAMGAVFGFGVLVAIGGWWGQRRHASQVFRDLQDGQVLFSMDDRTLKIRSACAAVELPWRLVRQVWKYPEFWLLVYSRNSFNTLPVSGVPASALAMLEEGVRSAGGRVA